MKKLLLLAGLLGGTALFSGQAMAADDWGACEPVGGTHAYDFSMNYTVMDTSKNTSGSVFPDAYSWGNGLQYNITCVCPSDTTLLESAYMSLLSPLMAGITVSGTQYYEINSNIQFAIAAKVFGNVNDYFYAPARNISNNHPKRQGCPDSAKNFGTGNTGKVSLYITHPFVGELVIPRINIANVYMTHKPDVYSSVPVAAIYLSGSIIVPQGCELSTGSTLEIPFGEYQAHDFKNRAGQPPNGVTKFTKELSFKCTNISDGVKIFLTIEGTPNAANTNAIDLGNPDIGAVVEGSQGNILVPNDVTSMEELNVAPMYDTEHRIAKTTITTYPISTTGKLPASGDYDGIATLRIEVE